MNDGDSKIKIDDWVQVYMWQSVSTYKHLAWNGREVIVLQVKTQKVDGKAQKIVVVSHPDWPSPLREEGVEVPFSAVKQHPSCNLFQTVHMDAMSICIENEWRQHPEINDRVVIKDGAYEEWYGAAVAALPYELTDKRYKSYSKRNQEWINRYAPENMPPAEIFLVRQIQDDLALVRANGENYKVPVNCLEVFERKSEARSEESVTA